MADEYNQNQQWQETQQYAQPAQPQYQQQYQQPVQQQYQAQTYMPTRKPDPVSVGNWMLTMLLSAIPIVNIIMVLVWAFGSSTEQSKSNWAKATLIWVLIEIALVVVICLVSGITLGELTSSYSVNLS